MLGGLKQGNGGLPIKQNDRCDANNNEAGFDPGLGRQEEPKGAERDPSETGLGR